MAVDEALVDAVRNGLARPTVRVYGWSPPAVSFGYAQRIGREVDPAKCRAAGVDIVRRPTGGRAVLHWNELTYSVVCPADDVDLGGSIQDAYRKISACLVAGIRELGLPVRFESRKQAIPSPRGFYLTAPCFSSAAQYEIIWRHRKLVGSAQQRVGPVLLQHGSLLIGPEHKRIVGLIPDNKTRLVDQFRSELDRHTVSLEEAMGERVSFERIAGAVRSGFESVFGPDLVPSPLDPAEWRAAEHLMETKYAPDAWVQREGPRTTSQVF